MGYDSWKTIDRGYEAYASAHADATEWFADNYDKDFKTWESIHGTEVAEARMESIISDYFERGVTDMVDYYQEQDAEYLKAKAERSDELLEHCREILISAGLRAQAMAMAA